MRLPNFLVIGAQRAGTTLLHHILDLHPDVYMPQRRKEVHYFDWYFERGPEWYSEFFPNGREARQYRAIGEATPDYLFDARAPARIAAVLPDCKLVVSLRNPIDRAFSWYLFCLRSVNEKRGPADFFSQETECLQRGLYAQQLSNYFALFPRSAFFIMIYEELIKDPAPQLESLASFLGLASGWEDPPSLVQQRFNASEIPRFRGAFARAQRFGELLTRHDLDWIVRLARTCGVPKMFGTRDSRPRLPESARRRLADYYCDEIASLERMLERDLGDWLPAHEEARRVAHQPTTDQLTSNGAE
jgi:Sulfotransferase domain